MFTSFIDGITGSIINVGPAETPAAAEKTAPVPPGGLIEWDGRNIVSYKHSSAKTN